MDSFLEQIEKNLYRLIGCFLLSCVMVFCVGTFFRLTQTGFLFSLVIFIPAVLVSGYAFLVERYPKPVLFLTPILLCIFCTIAGWDSVFGFAQEYVLWVQGVSAKDELPVLLFQVLQIVWIVIFCYIVQLLFERFFLLKAVTGAVFIAFLIYALFAKKEVPYSAVVFILVFLSVLLIQWTQIRWKKVKKQSDISYMLGMMLFVCVFFFSMIFLPISKEPYQWKYVKASVAYCKEKVTMLMNDLFQEEDTFLFSLAGFSEEGELGGTVVDEQREIMTITTDRIMQNNLYLAGKYFNEFSDMEWMANQDEGNNDVYIDTLKTVYALRSSETDRLNKHYKKVKLKIEYKNLNTRYLFAPEKTYEINDSKEKRIKYTIDQGSLFFKKNQNYGSAYYVDYYQMDLSSKPLNEFLKLDVKEDTALWNDLINSHKQTVGFAIKDSDFDDFEEMCYREYAQPVVLSEDVRNYLEEVTSGCNNDFDKLRAIEQELQTYSYSLHPGKVPKQIKDASRFLDYFLLDKKEGYCSYFATAFVLLARAEGFPARYVQGFCVPMYGKREAVVMSDMAHAWPEIYIQDIGWIAFEPTPGYSSMRYTTWKTVSESSAGSNYYTELYQGGKVDQESLQEEDKKEVTEVTVEVASLITKIILVFLLFAIILPAIVIMIKKAQYRNLALEEKYLLMIKRNFRLLRAFGLDLGESETVEEYAKRVEVQEVGAISCDFLNEYEEVIYGNRSVDDKLLHKIEEQYKETLLYLRNKSTSTYISYFIVTFIRYGG